MVARPGPAATSAEGPLGQGTRAVTPNLGAGMVPWKLLELLFPPAPSQAESIQWYTYSTSRGAGGAALGLGTQQGTRQVKTPREGIAYCLRWEINDMLERLLEMAAEVTPGGEEGGPSGKGLEGR